MNLLTITPIELADRIATLEGHVAALRGALCQAIEWDSVDDEGMPAVWLSEAERVMAATAPGVGRTARTV